MADTTDLLGILRRSVDQRRSPGPEARRVLAAATDPVLVRRAGRLLAGLDATDDELAPYRVGVLATCTIGSFEPLLRAGLVGIGARPDIELGDYGTFGMTLSAPDFPDPAGPRLQVLLTDPEHFLPRDWSGADVETLVQHVGTRGEELRALVAGAAERAAATLVVHTVPLPREVRDTLVSWRARAALAAAWHRLNGDLMALAAEHRQVVAIDLAGLLAENPYPARDARMHRYADLPYTDAALLVLSRQVARVVQASAGLSRKVLALDLDDTLWGGVLGEVGAEGVALGGLYPGRCYLDLQRTARRLREQGVILVLASKNDPQLVTRALLEHPEVVLRPDAFSATAVNWSPKAGNLATAAAALGLSPGSFVFMDDSAFERGQVTHDLPEVAVVSAAGEPAELVSSLVGPGWFDTLELTATDRTRPQLYRTRAERSSFANGFASTQDYLQALDIELTIEPVTGFTVARAAQLAARTNQFNLTGLRFDEATTAAMGTDPDHRVLTVAMTDRFGDEGIVGAIWIGCGPAWRVLNMVLSCRVLGRGVELAVLAHVQELAGRAGAVAVEGRFVATDRNGAAAGFWPGAGFAGTSEPGVFRTGLDARPGPGPGWITLRERTGART